MISFYAHCITKYLNSNRKVGKVTTSLSFHIPNSTPPSEKWSKHRSGLYNSTAGSTASLVVVRGNKLIVAHVGDSTVTLTRNGT